jgi:hypothetical protein
MATRSLLDDFELFQAANSAAKEFGIRPELLHSLIQQESGGDPAARSPKGALGLMQLMPGTAKDMGVDPADPLQNLRGGAKYLRSLLDRYKGDEKLALAAYNAGPGNVDKAGGIPNFPETRTYVANIERNGAAPPAAAPQEPVERAADGEPAPPVTKARVDALYQQHVGDDAKPLVDEFEKFRAPKGADDFAAFQASQPAPEMPNAAKWLRDTLKDVANSAVDVVKHPIENAPVIGGAIGAGLGGMAGGIGSVPGAALGGAAGESARELYDFFTGDTEHFDPASSALDRTGKIATQGAIQGATELGGKLLFGAGGGNAMIDRSKKLYQGVLKPTKSLLKKTTAYATGGYNSALDELLTTALEERVPATKAGLSKTQDLIDTVDQSRRDLVANSTKSVRPADVEAHLDPVHATYAWALIL